MPRLNEADDETVSQWGDDLGFQQEELDQSTFLFLCHELKGFFSIRSQYRRSQDALDVIDVITDDYKGHLFSDLYNLYEQAYIFKLPIITVCIMKKYHRMAFGFAPPSQEQDQPS